MKNLIALATLGLLLAGASGSATAESAKVLTLPRGSALACQGSVDDFGDRERAPFSISWWSYGVREDVSTISRFYEKTFGRSPEPDQHGGLSWKFADGLIYTVHSVGAAAHWLACADKLGGIKAVIVVSRGGAKAVPHDADLRSQAWDLRRRAAPAIPKPASISASEPGSGTWATSSKLKSSIA